MPDIRDSFSIIFNTYFDEKRSIKWHLSRLQNSGSLDMRAMLQMIVAIAEYIDKEIDAPRREKAKQAALVEKRVSEVRAEETKSEDIKEDQTVSEDKVPMVTDDEIDDILKDTVPGTTEKEDATGPLDSLEDMEWKDLQAKARELGIPFMQKREALIEAIKAKTSVN